MGELKEKSRFYKNRVKIGHFLRTGIGFSNEMVILRVEGRGGGNRQTQRHTHALMVWELGRWLFGGLGGGGGGGGEEGGRGRIYRL